MRRHLIALRWLPFSAVSAVAALMAPVLWTDWEVAHAAGNQILSASALTVYADQPMAQMGPLALLFAALPKTLFILLTSALLTPFLYLCETWVPLERRQSPKRTTLCVAIGGGLLAYPWSDFASQGHLDDVLVLFGCALMLRGIARRSPVQTGLAFALAIAGKPTAILFAPALLPAGMTAIAIACIAMAVIWSPFLLADPHGFLIAGKGVTEVRPGSLPSYLGLELWGPTPSWIRLLALGGGALICLAFVRRGDVARAMVAAFALRAAVDPNPAQCYASSLVALGLLADVSCRRVPWTAITGLGGWILSIRVIVDPILGWPRILVTVLSPLVAPRTTRAIAGRGGGATRDDDPQSLESQPAG